MEVEERYMSEHVVIACFIGNKLNPVAFSVAEATQCQSGGGQHDGR